MRLNFGFDFVLLKTTWFTQKFEAKPLNRVAVRSLGIDCTIQWWTIYIGCKFGLLPVNTFRWNLYIWIVELLWEVGVWLNNSMVTDLHWLQIWGLCRIKKWIINSWSYFNSETCILQQQAVGALAAKFEALTMIIFRLENLHTSAASRFSDPNVVLFNPLYLHFTFNERDNSGNGYGPKFFFPILWIWRTSLLLSHHQVVSAKWRLLWVAYSVTKSFLVFSTACGLRTLNPPTQAPTFALKQPPSPWLQLVQLFWGNFYFNCTLR